MQLNYRGEKATTFFRVHLFHWNLLQRRGSSEGLAQQIQF